MSTIVKLHRRDFLKVSSAASAGLVLGFYLPPRKAAAAADTVFQPNAWLQIHTDGKVSIWLTKSEMGQGVRTALPMIVAEELDADWEKVEIIQAHLDRKFGNQGTGGSASVRTTWEPLRKAGATAREMLVAAAAQTWNVDKSACRTEKGYVLNGAGGKKLSYGELAETAAKLSVPTDVKLKDPKTFTLVGKSLPRVDTPDKVTGQATYGIDVRMPGMLFASVERCPVFGGKVAKYDDGKAKAVPGVKHVMQTRNGIAVVAENSWAAFNGRDALEITWDEGSNAGESAETLRQHMEELTAQPAKTVRNDGDVDAAVASAAKRVEAVYELPFLAHAPMEPMNCTAHVTKDRCEVWAPTQSPGWVHRAAKQITGLADEAIRVNVTYLGGGFGRRWFPGEVEDAIEVAKLVGVPVQVIWKRDDDLQHGYYRPASYHRFQAGLDADGWPLAWHHRFASTSILTALQPDTKTPERTEIGGAAEFPYAVPNVRVEYASAKSAAPRGWLRSVEHTFNAFVVQSFIDELAHAAGKDPYEYRLHLLREPRRLTFDDEICDTARLRRVLELAAEKAGWGKPLASGRARGIAQHWSFHTYAAEVAEVSLRGGQLRVERVVCAVDCGRVIHPDIVKAQIAGGAIYGLSEALHEITLDRGRVVQSNFHDYPIVRIDESPVIEVHIVESTEPPTGVGEPGTPPIAPAVANAVFALTGKRIRKLPIRPAELA